MLSAGGVQNTPNYYENTQNYQLLLSKERKWKGNKIQKLKWKKKLFWIVWLNTNCFWTSKMIVCIFNGVHYEFIFKTISLNSLKTIDCNQSIWLIACNDVILSSNSRQMLFPPFEILFSRFVSVLWKLHGWNETECVCVRVCMCLT